MKTQDLQRLLRGVTQEAIANMAGVTELRAEGERHGQYGLDLVVDGPLVESLLDAGLGVLSEEAGVIEPERELVAIVDPIDGSTNASRQLPWFNTSIAVIDDVGVLAAIVENHVTGERFEAVRSEGAFRNGEPMTSPSGTIATGVVGVNGVPPKDGPWAQFRCFGASALDLCAVAVGALDGYVDFDESAHGVWDYAAAYLVCSEVGVPVVDAFGRELIHRDHNARRTPIAAHRKDDVDLLVELRKR